MATTNADVANPIIPSYIKGSLSLGLSGSYSLAQNGNDYVSDVGGTIGVEKRKIKSTPGASAVMGWIIGESGTKNSEIDSFMSGISISMQYFTPTMIGVSPVFGLTVSPGSKTAAVEIGIGIGQPGSSLSVEHSSRKY